MSSPGSSSPGGHPATAPPPIDVDPPFDDQSNASGGSSDPALGPSNASDVSSTSAAPGLLSGQADQNPWPDSGAGHSDMPSYSMDLSLGRRPSPDLHFPLSDQGQPSLNSPMSINSSALRRADGILDSPTPSVSTNDDQRVPSRSDMRNQTPDSAGHGYVTPEPPFLPAEEILLPAVCPSRAMSIITGEHGSSTDSSASMHTTGTLTPTSQLEILSIEQQPGNPSTGMGAPVAGPSSGAYGGARPRRRHAAPATIEEENTTTDRHPAPCLCSRCGVSLEPSYAAHNPGVGLCPRCLGGEYEESVPLSALIESSRAAERADLSSDAAIQPPDLPREGIMRVSQWVAETVGMGVTELEDITNAPISAAAALADNNWGGSHRNIADTNVSSLTNLERDNSSGGSGNAANLLYRTMDIFHGSRGVGASVSGFDTGASVSGFDTGASVSGFDTGASVSGFDAGGSVSGPNVGVGASGPNAGVGASGPNAGVGASGPNAGVGASGPNAGVGASGPNAGVGASGLDASANISGPNAESTSATASGIGDIGLDTEFIDSARARNMSAPDASGSNSTPDANVAMTDVATAAHLPIRPTNFPTGFGTPADGVRAIITNQSSSLGSGSSGRSVPFPGVVIEGSDGVVVAGGSDGGSATGRDVGGADSGASGGNSPAREGSPRDLRSRNSPYSTSRRSTRDSPSSPDERGRGGKIKKPSGSRMALVTYDIADDAFAAMFPKLASVSLRSLLKNEFFKITTFNFPERFNQFSTNINAEQNSVRGDVGSEGCNICNTSKDSIGDSIDCSDEEDSF